MRARWAGDVLSDVRVIYKYPFLDGDPALRVDIPWDETSRVVLVAAQTRLVYGEPVTTNDLPTIWVDQPYVSPLNLRTFVVIGTGLTYSESDIGEFIGSAICANGHFVWHVFAEPFAGQGKEPK